MLSMHQPTRHPHLSSILSLFDETLQELGQPRLLENPLFVPAFGFDANLFMPFAMAVRANNAPVISFNLSQDGISFSIDRANEIPEWGYDTIVQNPEHVKQIIRNILTAWVLVEHKGTKTVVRLFDQKGEQVNCFSCWEGIGLNFLKSSTYLLYHPLLG